MVAEDDVRAVAGVDRVAGRAADEDVVAGPGGDGVGATIGDVDALEQVQGGPVGCARHVLQPAVVAEDHV